MTIIMTMMSGSFFFFLHHHHHQYQYQYHHARRHGHVCFYRQRHVLAFTISQAREGLKMKHFFQSDQSVFDRVCHLSTSIC